MVTLANTDPHTLCHLADRARLPRPDWSGSAPNAALSARTTGRLLSPANRALRSGLPGRSSMVTLQTSAPGVGGCRRRDRPTLNGSNPHVAQWAAVPPGDRARSALEQMAARTDLPQSQLRDVFVPVDRGVRLSPVSVGLSAFSAAASGRRALVVLWLMSRQLIEESSGFGYGAPLSLLQGWAGERRLEDAHGALLRVVKETARHDPGLEMDDSWVWLAVTATTHSRHRPLTHAARNLCEFAVCETIAALLGGHAR